MKQTKNRSWFWGLAFSALVSCGWAAEPRVNIWSGAANDWDWSDGRNFTLGEIQENDVVSIPSGRTVRLISSHAASVTAFGKVSGVMPEAEDSVLRVEVAEGDFTIGIPLANYPNGKLVKDGEGDLWLESVATAADYRLPIDILAGALHLPTATPRNVTIGNISVAGTAALFTAEPASAGDSVMTTIGRLSGLGLVTNRIVGGVNNFRVNGGTKADPCTFSGVMGGGLCYYSYGNVILTGTHSTMSEAATVFSNTLQSPGRTSFLTVGNVGEPSSLGAGPRIEYGEKGGVFRYLGSGATTDRMVSMRYGVQGPAEFDGGPNGGLTFTGGWDAYGSKMYANVGMSEIVLSGENENACVIAGCLQGYRESNPSSGLVHTGSVHVVKRGSGEWDLLCRTNLTHTATTVEAGELSVATLTERGDASSLGDASDPMEAYCGEYSKEHAVDWALTLGGNGTTGTLSVAEGEGNGILSTTRLLRLAGDGCFKNDTASPFRFSGVTTDGEARTLTLCGTATTGENVLGDIFDTQSAPVTIVKDGSGEWMLSATNSFHGALEVRSGTLKVGTPSDKFTWFRWTIKECFDPSLTYVQANEFALFGTDNWRINMTNGTTSCGWSVCRNYAAIQPNQMAYQTTRPYSVEPAGGVADYDLLSLVDCHATTEGWQYNNQDAQGAAKALSADDPSTWVPILIRLAADANEVGSYDFAVRYGSTNSGNKRNPNVWTLEGSVDGLHWHRLHGSEEGTMQVNGNAYYLASKKSDNGDASIYNSKAQKIVGATNLVVNVLEDVSSVSVADGATLVATDGNQCISHLKVNVNGAGTISGFTFAESGTLEVENLPGGARTVTLPGTYDCSGLDRLGNGNWQVSSGGRLRHHAIEVKDGKITLVPPGLILIFR